MRAPGKHLWERALSKRTSIRRTIRFILLLNRFEQSALRRIVEAGGYRSASEALRYLIRREDPEALDIEPDRESDQHE